MIAAKRNDESKKYKGEIIKRVKEVKRKRKNEKIPRN